jgi:HEAT repeat protein
MPSTFESGTFESGIFKDHHAVLQQAADRGDWEAVSDGLLELDPNLHGADILAWSLQVLTQGDFPDSWQVAKVLPKLGDVAIQPLLDLLQNTELEAASHWCAGRILGELPSPLVVAGVIEQLSQDPSVELAEILVRVLTDLGTVAIQQLTQLLAISHQRKAAVLALGHIRHSQTIEPLISVVSDPNAEIRRVAIEALGSFHDVRVPPLLIKALTDLDSNVRRVAVISLGMRPELAKEMQLVDRLAPLLQDLFPGVYLAAAVALGRIGSEAAAIALKDCYQKNTCPVDLRKQIVSAWGAIDLPITLVYLGQVLWSADAETAVVAARSLDRLKGQQLSVAKLLGDYIQNPAANNTPRLRQELTAVLGNMSGLLGVESIVLLLADPDERVRWQAIYCLQQGGSKVVGKLQQLAQAPTTTNDLVEVIQQYLTHLQSRSQ